MSKVAEVKGKKRKGAAEESVAAKKVKTTPEKTDRPLRSAMKKAAPAEKAATTSPAAAVKKNTRPARKRAEDLIEKEAEKPAKAAAPAKASAKAKKVVEPTPEEPAAKESAASKVSKAKGKKAAEKPAKEEVAVAVAAAEEDDDEDDDEEDVDDQTAALLAGFESSDDENDPEADATEGVPMDKVPAIPNDKDTRKQLNAAAKNDAENKPGVLYVGRIPHGFFEHQMRAYFSQFGDITHLRLSRNKVTGRSKHYAFLEFASSAVADIVAKTMDKYLLFGHILQVRRIPAEQVHEKLWKGEGRRFKVMPRNKIEGSVLAKGRTREVWEKKVAKETQKREKQAAKLKEIGYEFEMPALRSVDDVSAKEVLEGEGAGLLDAGEVKAILEKKPEVDVESVQTVQKGDEIKITATAKVTEKAGTKRAKAKGDGKKAKKAKVAA